MAIILLDAKTINRIAAGEVIERPASVVKELVENAIDAGSSEIEIKIESGGRNLITVLDNGNGIEKEDIELAFKRHATSKLKNDDDLMEIKHLGFRGEALPSIAAVSRIKLSSRAKAAWSIAYEGGEKVMDLTPASIPGGTEIEVRDLFFATPNRLKFLKTERAKTQAIVDIINNLAMINPSIGFTLSANNKRLLKYNKQESLLFRLREIAKEFAENSLVYRTLDTIRTNMGHDLCGKKMHREEMYDFEPKKHLGQIKTFYKKIKQVVENVVEEEGLKIPSLFSYEKGKSIKEDIVRKEMEEQIAREFAELKAELIEFENRPDVIEQRRIKAEQEEEQEKIINELAELRRKAYPIFREKVSKFEDKLQDIIKTIENKDNKIVEAIIHYVKDNGQYSVEQVMNAVITEIELNKEQIIKEVTELSKHKEEKMRGLKAYEKEEQRSCEIEKTRGIYQLIDKFINAGIARFNISENNIDELSQNSESKQTEPDTVVDEVKVEEGVDVVLDLVSQAGPSWKM